MTLMPEPAPAAPELPEGVRLRHGQFYGVLVIEWPPARTPPVLPAFAEVCAYELDAEGAERLLPYVTRLTLNVAPHEITADVETLLGHDGEPAGGVRPPVGYLRITDDMLKRDESGEFATAVFRYVVGEIRLADVRARGLKDKPPAATVPEGDDLDS